MGSVEELCDEISLINRSQVILEGTVKDVKNRFRTRTFELQFRGYNIDLGIGLGAQFQLLDNRKVDDTSVATIRIPENKNLNDLLGALLRDLEIVSVHEIVPDMNQIFIEAVNTFNSQQA